MLESVHVFFKNVTHKFSGIKKHAAHAGSKIPVFCILAVQEARAFNLFHT